VGNWDLHSGRLVFAAEVKDSPGEEAVRIILAGKTKGGAGGLMYSAGAEGEEQLALEISGSYQWNGGQGHWEVAVGFSRINQESKLTAKIARDGTTQKQLG